jgi:hypothetical protein
MFDVAGGVGCREDVAQRRGYSNRSNAAHSTSLPSSHDFDVASRASSLAATGLAQRLDTARRLQDWRVAIRDSRIATFTNKLV